MRPYYSDDHVTLYHGDCLDVLATLPDASVDSVVTDPPYGLEFMGKDWDAPWKSEDKGVHAEARTRRADEMVDENKRRFIASAVNKFAAGKPFQDWCEQWATECLRVLKPGGHMLAFGGTRTWHRLAVAVEDAGFEVRDSIAWLYAQGFPKSMNPGRDQRFCQCEKVEYEHDSIPAAQAEHDVRAVRDGDVPEAVRAAGGEGALLLSGLPEPGAPAARRAELSAAEDGAGQPRMEGRSYVQEAEGQLRGAALREVPGGTAVHGEVGRLRDGAPASHGSQDRATAAEVGSGEPHQPRPTGQPTGEPGVVPEQRGPQAGRGGPVCRRCGKPPAPVGLGTALKPSFEPIVVARKPLTGTVAANVLEHGTGALNIDATRVAATDKAKFPAGVVSETEGIYGAGVGRYANRPRTEDSSPAGRWPANVLLDDSQAAELDRQSGIASTARRVGKRSGKDEGTYGAFEGQEEAVKDPGGEGGASRFFPTFRYEAKAPTSERPRVDGIAHPTVKPLDLMRWLVRLVTPPDGTVLEPFAGSGTTAEACVLEGFQCIAIEREPDYLPLIVSRLSKPMQLGLDFGAHAKYNREALLAAVTEQRDKHPRPKEDNRGLVQGR